MATNVKLSQSGHFRLGVARFFIYVVLIVLAIVAIVPVWLVFMNATRSTEEIYQSMSFLPSKSLVSNWNFIMSRDVQMWTGYKNSAIVTVSSTVLTVYFSMLTAYAIEVYNFRFKEFFRRFIYILVLIPQSVAIIGFVQFMSRLHLTNTFWPLIIPAIAAPGSVFFAEQYLKTALVKDLILSARIDGCGEFGIFHRIMIPMAKPGIFTLAIFSFVASWNNFFLPSMILSTTDKYTVPLVVKLLKGDRFRTNVGAVYVGIVMSVLPVIVVFVLLSKQIVGGLTLGALKE